MASNYGINVDTVIAMKNLTIYLEDILSGQDIASIYIEIVLLKNWQTAYDYCAEAKQTPLLHSFYI